MIGELLPECIGLGDVLVDDDMVLEEEAVVVLTELMMGTVWEDAFGGAYTCIGITSTLEPLEVTCLTDDGLGRVVMVGELIDPVGAVEEGKV